jgi:DNA repair protein RadC
MRHLRPEVPVKLDGLSSARDFFAGCLADCDPKLESLWVAHVDDQSRCIHLSRFQGDETGADFPVRRIIADAVQHGSAGIVLAHNHPSGDALPSESDCRCTRKLATAAEALDCSVLDHLVFGGTECTSFRRMRLL